MFKSELTEIDGETLEDKNGLAWGIAPDLIAFNYKKDGKYFDYGDVLCHLIMNNVIFLNNPHWENDISEEAKKKILYAIS